MELYEQILLEAAAKERVPWQGIDPAQVVEGECYQAIQKIRNILSDERLEDPECFARIEQIVDVLDDLGIGGGGRHDFG